MRNRIAKRVRRIQSDLSQKARRLASRSGMKFEPKVALLNPHSSVNVSAGKRRMIVVGGSLGSNAIGRAYMLADLAAADFAVEIVGTLLPSRGRNLWKPLKDANIPIRGFVADDMISYLSGACSLVRSSPCEIVYVSKPRFSGFFIGMLLSMKNNCPLLLDIDDLELSFAKNRLPLAFDQLAAEFRLEPAQIDNLASAMWIRFSETLVGEADAITLSNESLQTRYDGALLRHARDETQFIPDEARRRAMRQELGIRDDQKAVLFVGTPQPHKGLDKIAAIFSAREDDRIVLCIVGAENNSAVREKLGIRNTRNVHFFPAQSFARLPDLIRAGDAVCLLQDSSSMISEFQIPAKLSESLALGLPVLASRVTPFAGLIASGAITPIDNNEDLRRALDDICTKPEDPLICARRRELFLSEFSYAANRPRLLRATHLAEACHAKAPHRRNAAIEQIAQCFASQFGIDVLQSIRKA